MNSVGFSSTCRICLQDNATYSIFDESTTTEASILSQFNKCFMEKLEDVEGYPRKICSSCKITLDMLCEFIDKYRESCEILRESLFKVKKEIDNSLIENDHDYGNNYDDDFVWDDKEYVEVKVENNNDTLTHANEILERLNVPGLKITKVKSKKCKKKAESYTTVKTRSKTKCVKPKENKLKKLATKRETVPKRIEKLKEIGEKEEKIREKLPLLCDICGAVLNTRERLTIHIKSKHLNKKYTCSICSKQYNSSLHLRNHKRLVHSDKKFMCDLCSKEFKTKDLLKNHIKVVHNKERKKKTFTCKYCNKMYKCAQSTTIHERSEHTGLRPAVCEVCGKAFFHKIYLKEHMRLHTGELPFKCPFCDRGCTQLGNLKSHLRQHKMSELNETIMIKMRPSFIKCLKKC